MRITSRHILGVLVAIGLAAVAFTVTVLFNKHKKK